MPPSVATSEGHGAIAIPADQAAVQRAEAIAWRFLAFANEPANGLFGAYFDGTQLPDPPDAIERAITLLAATHAQRGDGKGVALMRILASLLGAVTLNAEDSALLGRLRFALAVAPKGCHPAGEQATIALENWLTHHDDFFALNAIRHSRTMRLLRGVEAAVHGHPAPA